MIKPFVVAAAVVLLPEVGAQAASMVSSPIQADGTGSISCSIHYIGTSTTPIPLLITIKEGPSVIRRDNAARLSVTQPSYATGVECGRGQTLSCNNVVCAFSFTGDKSLFRASACTLRTFGGESAGQFCLPAY